jgi:hypothetical protein
LYEGRIKYAAGEEDDETWAALLKKASGMPIKKGPFSNPRIAHNNSLWAARMRVLIRRPLPINNRRLCPDSGNSSVQQCRFLSLFLSLSNSPY